MRYHIVADQRLIQQVGIHRRIQNRTDIGIDEIIKTRGDQKSHRHQGVPFMPKLRIFELCVRLQMVVDSNEGLPSELIIIFKA